MIKCPKCGSRSAVVDSRPEDDTVRRRRECSSCKTRWHTVEVKALSVPVGEPKRLPYAPNGTQPSEWRLKQDLRRVLARHGLPPEIVPKMYEVLQ